MTEAQPSKADLSSFQLRNEPLDADASRTLISALNAELASMYPEPGATHLRLEPEETAPGRGAFLVGYVGSVAVACGAVRKISDDTAEIKRMFVLPDWRGLGLSTRLLAELESEAARLGARRIVLETGERQREALALYQRHGYLQIAPFGEYVGSPLSICMEKIL
jgi:GNAT superfamily N-acetyltransferase